MPAGLNLLHIDKKKTHFISIDLIQTLYTKYLPYTLYSQFLITKLWNNMYFDK